MAGIDGELTDRTAAWRDVVATAARLICECDGRRWEALAPWEQDRYARVAALVEDTIARMRGESSRAAAMN